MTPKVLIVLSPEECDDLWTFLHRHVIPPEEYPHLWGLLDRIDLSRVTDSRVNAAARAEE